MAENIGKSNCLVCGAGVMVKKNVAKNLYYSCNGGEDEEGRGCGTQVRFAAQRSRILEANLKAMNDNQQPAEQSKADNENEPERVEQHNEPNQQPKRTGTYEDYFR